MAVNHDLHQFGLKRIRKIGQQQEFDHIKEYVTGEDYRTINWKATARKAKLMVNQYQAEKSQPVYSLIDKGRVMFMPFGGMSLLDYSINASLAISKISIQKDDRPGLITFQDKIETLIPASNRNIQMHLLMEALYHQKTDFRESDFSRLYATLKNKITHRSLLLLFTNFESFSAMERQLSFLKKIAFNHLLVVIFFENTELQKLSYRKAKNTRDVYHQVIGMKFAYQKKLIVSHLNQLGIQTILTSPESVTVDTINKYLEFKARGMI